MLRFHSAFTDHMVLQRDVPVQMSGWSQPSVSVKVSLNDIHVQSVSDKTGHWRLTLPPLEASGVPAQLTLQSADQTVILSDVLVGEVWFCAGQSNMEFALRRSQNAERILPAATNPSIRLLHVEKNPSEEMLPELHGQQWSRCTPETAGEFSAVAYYFGLELQQRLGVPVGLILAAWGGTRIESWMSRDRLEAIHCAATSLADYDKIISDSRNRRISGADDRPPQLEGDPLVSKGLELGWAEPSTSISSWPSMELPTKWQEQGYQQSGVFWFRREVDIPETWADHDLHLSLGAIDKSDVAYWNGTEVGTTPASPLSYTEPRGYKVPSELVRPGHNTIAVRVRSEYYDGGMTGPAEAMTISCPDQSETAPVPLAGDWQFKVENDYGYRHPSAPTQLFNGMVAPYLDFTIRGVAWYQGENNKNGPQEYEILLEEFIGDLRERWSCGDLPFLIVQLVYCSPPSPYQPEAPYCMMRTIQDQVARKMRCVAVTDAYDVVEYSDPAHPRLKQPIGKRLAAQALSQVQGIPETTIGPRMKAVHRQGQKVRAIFDVQGSPLTIRGESDTVEGFALAGPDGVFHPAEGQIEGHSVVIGCPEVTEPAAIAYAWAENPICNLYNMEGYPTAPFRTQLSAPNLV